MDLVWCNTKQTHCNTLQHTATHCSTECQPVDITYHSVCHMYVYLTWRHACTLRTYIAVCWECVAECYKVRIIPYVIRMSTSYLATPVYLMYILYMYVYVCRYSHIDVTHVYLYVHLEHVHTYKTCTYIFPERHLYVICMSTSQDVTRVHHTYIHCSMLRVCCSVLQDVAVCHFAVTHVYLMYLHILREIRQNVYLLVVGFVT